MACQVDARIPAKSATELPRSLPPSTPPGLAMRSGSVGPFITALICGLVTTGLLWPDLSAPSAHETSLGLLIVSLSFILGPGALYIAYVPAIAAGSVTAVISYLLIRIGSRSRDDRD